MRLRKPKTGGNYHITAEGSGSRAMPRSKRASVPSYRLHKPSGRAVVRLNERDYYLGPHGTEQSRAAYERLIAEWIAHGRQMPPDHRPAHT
ncbi:MAG: hypothetical protein AMXMBFR13_32040 [Phycisphaerae bacterium]